MKRILKVSSLAFSICFMMMAIYLQDAKAQPTDYAKWSRAALTEVKKQYPNMAVDDFKYLGRKVVSNTKSKDTFDFLLQKNTKKKLVRVYVSFNPQTNQLLNIQLKVIGQ